MKILTIMMPAMTKTSRRVLFLSLLFVGPAFLVYPSSPTAKANIKKAQPTSMSVPRKVIGSALIDLHHNKTTINDKWLTLRAIRKLIYSRFDFDAGIDFTAGDLKRAVNALGPVASKISQRNHTRIHLREKATRACLTTCILLSSSKDTQPEEPIEGKAWIQSLELSEALVNSVLQTIVPIKTFRERSASGTLFLVDRSIAKMPTLWPLVLTLQWRSRIWST
jgi:hypothetical protein